MTEWISPASGSRTRFEAIRRSKDLLSRAAPLNYQTSQTLVSALSGPTRPSDPTGLGLSAVAIFKIHTNLKDGSIGHGPMPSPRGQECASGHRRKKWH